MRTYNIRIIYIMTNYIYIIKNNILDNKNK